jgi:hypothetical protein
MAPPAQYVSVPKLDGIRQHRAHRAIRLSVQGQGIRFALASAYNGAAVVRTWRDDPAAAESASQFYLDLWTAPACSTWNSAASLRLARSGSPTGRLPAHVRLSCRIVTANVNRDSRITQEDALESPDGKVVRWAGDFDLLRLRDIVRASLATEVLIKKLERVPMSQEQAMLLVAWCFERRILT